MPTTYPSSEHRLLILACSRRKLSIPEPIPAIDRYDGPLFRTLRKYLRQEPDRGQALDVAILSAHYGLIRGADPTLDYDKRMTPARAALLQPSVHTEIQQFFSARPYDQLFISVGQEYAPVIGHTERIVPSNCVTTVATGSHGQRQAEMYRWLYGQPPTPRPLAISTEGVRLRGRIITLSASDALNSVRQALVSGYGSPANFQYWYVEVDGQRVSAKWFVSLISGLPTSAFGSEEARRVLTSLGIEVCSL